MSCELTMGYKYLEDCAASICIVIFSGRHSLSSSRNAIQSPQAASTPRLRALAAPTGSGRAMTRRRLSGTPPSPSPWRYRVHRLRPPLPGPRIPGPEHYARRARKLGTMVSGDYGRNCAVASHSMVVIGRVSISNSFAGTLEAQATRNCPRRGKALAGRLIAPERLPGSPRPANFHKPLQR